MDGAYYIDRTMVYGYYYLLRYVIFRQPSSYLRVAEVLRDPRSRLRELWLLDVPPANMDIDEPDELGAALLELKEVCRLNNVKVNV